MATCIVSLTMRALAVTRVTALVADVLSLPITSTAGGPLPGSLLGRARGPSSPTFRRYRCALVSHAVHVALTAAHSV